MGKQEEALRLAEELLADIELKKLAASEIVLKSSRLARLVGHDQLLEFLDFERNGYPSDGSGVGWVTSAGRWTDGEEGKYWPMSLAKVEAAAEGSRQALATLKGGGSYSGDYAYASSRDHDQRINLHARELTKWSSICSQVVATAYDFVVAIYHELLFSDLQASLFAEVQTRIDGELATASGAALDKIERISQRLRDGDNESVSQALTTCRRLVDACADHLFPAQGDAYSVNEQTTLAVGQQNVLNRLQAYCHSAGLSKGRLDRLRRTMADLYDRCSAGTHSDVTVDEARFVFLATYVTLGEILSLGR